jgi:hypothetical protein
MFKFTTAKFVAIVVLAVLVAGMAAYFLVPEARAESQVTGAPAPSHAEGDRLPAPVMASECSSRGWPHYEKSCQFDLRGPEHQARTVRIIALR